jgi:uncharacterized protein
MNPVFADTSYYYALLSSRDIAHRESLHVSNSLRRSIMTTEFVLLELANAFSCSAQRRVIGQLIDQFRCNPRITIIPASSELFMQGISLYSQRQDKEWSLTDCISFIVMQEYNLTEVLTTDHHFTQAGLISLMNPPPRHPR